MTDSYGLPLQLDINLAIAAAPVPSTGHTGLVALAARVSWIQRLRGLGEDAMQLPARI